MVRPALTGRGWTVALLAPVLYGLGEWLGYPFLRVLGAVMAVTLVVTVGAAARPLRLDVRRTADQLRVHRTKTVHVELVVTNIGRFPQPEFPAIDVAEGHGEPLTVPALDPGASARLAYQLVARRRGRHVIGPLRIDRFDPLGLTLRRRSAGPTAELVVLPFIRPVRTVRVAPPSQHFDGPATGAIRGSSDLRALREYVPGDEPRHIHWKATAASGTLMVRDLIDPTEPRLTVLVDDRRSVLTADEFEDACELAASVLDAAARERYRVCLLSTTGLVVAPQPGPFGLGVILDALCDAKQSKPGPPVGSFADQAVDGALVLVSGLREQSLSWFAAASRRTTCVVFDLHAVQDQPLPGIRVIAAAKAEAGARLWNVMAAQG